MQIVVVFNYVVTNNIIGTGAFRIMSVNENIVTNFKKEDKVNLTT